ncbi:MAG: 4Fe-4S binding protein, partial [Desulfurococcales archaeon]|nr:4Fe-4S binding protein [Desulfurococcales archaeon]
MTVVIDENTAELIQVNRNKVDLDIVEKGQVRKRILDLILSDTPVVGVYNGAYLEYNELWKLIKSKGGNPYLYEPLDSSHLLSLPTELASVLPTAKHAGLQNTKPWKIQYRVSAQKTVSRRTLLLKPMAAIREYNANPVLVDYKACASAKRCSLCIDSCPENALVGKPPSVDPVKCTGCGICAGICPFNALVMPGWGVMKIEGELDLIREKYSGPLAMIIVERPNLPELTGLREIHSPAHY